MSEEKEIVDKGARTAINGLNANQKALDEKLESIEAKLAEPAPAPAPTPPVVTAPIAPVAPTAPIEPVTPPTAPPVAPKPTTPTPVSSTK